MNYHVKPSIREWISNSILLRGFRTTVELLMKAGFDEERATALVQQEHDEIMNAGQAGKEVR